MSGYKKRRRHGPVALRVMLYLARQPEGKYSSGPKIAAAIGALAPRVRDICTFLTHAELTVSLRGNGGGIMFNPRLSSMDVTVEQIFTAVCDSVEINDRMYKRQPVEVDVCEDFLDKRVLDAAGIFYDRVRSDIDRCFTTITLADLITEMAVSRLSHARPIESEEN